MKVLDKGGREKAGDNFPFGAIVNISTREPMPVGWALCDGTGGTPDLRDRFIVGDSAVGTGTASGTISPTAVLAHDVSIAGHSNHAVTQPANHSNHAVTEFSAHTSHGVSQPNLHGTHTTFSHTHNAHTQTARTAAGVGTEVITPTTHSTAGHAHDAHAAHSGATVDAHSAHSGTAVDAHSAHSGAAVDAHSAHSVTQSNNHPVMNHYLLAYIMRVAY